MASRLRSHRFRRRLLWVGGIAAVVGIAVVGAIRVGDTGRHYDTKLVDKPAWVYKTPTEAIYEGCLVRFRPIMMTRMATMLGALPIALGFGSGGEARRPLGLAVVGGLVVSQVITLYLTPVVYTFMSTWVKTRKIPASVAAPLIASERT